MNGLRQLLEAQHMRTVDLHRGLEGAGVKITLSAVQQWVGGQTRPRAELLGLIADALKLDPSATVSLYRAGGAPLASCLVKMIEGEA